MSIGSMTRADLIKLWAANVMRALEIKELTNVELMAAVVTAAGAEWAAMTRNLERTMIQDTFNR